MYTKNDAQIVVGVDGSDGATLAVAWAVRDAMRLRIPLVLFRAYDRPVERNGGERAAIEKRIRAELAQFAHDLQVAHPDLEVRIDAAEGSAGVLLLGESRCSQLVVVGSRKLGVFGSVLLGSVGAALASSAACPVIVVRAPAATNGPPQRVVVGVNIAQDAHAVLDFAFEYASRRGLRLSAVACVQSDPDVTSHDSYAHLLQNELEPRLDAVLAPWREKYPDVRAVGAIVVDHPVAALVQESAGQTLLVVGSRGYRSTAAGLLGSVSHGVLQHAACPVAVVPVRAT
jgi:nucleotide-binding universal stress UspA family protein